MRERTAPHQVSQELSARALPSTGAAGGVLAPSSVVIFSRIAARNHLVWTPGAISRSIMVSSALPTTVACRPEVVTTRSPLTSDFCSRCASAIARFCRREFSISSAASTARSSSGRNWEFMVLRSPSALRHRVCQVALQAGSQRLWNPGRRSSARRSPADNLDTTLLRMAQQPRPFGLTGASFVARRGPVGAATEPGLSGSQETKTDSLGFRQQPPMEFAAADCGPSPWTTAPEKGRTRCRRTATRDLDTDRAPTPGTRARRVPTSWYPMALPLPVRRWCPSGRRQPRWPDPCHR